MTASAPPLTASIPAQKSPRRRNRRPKPDSPHSQAPSALRSASGIVFEEKPGRLVLLPSALTSFTGGVPIPSTLASSLRVGDLVEGRKSTELVEIHLLNGVPYDSLRRRSSFYDLTPVYPRERLFLERDTRASRLLDLASPIGKGQRGLIVSPPKSGKTYLLKEVAASIATNNPEVELLVLLVDERPEEVTDLERAVKGTVYASTFDRPARDHTRLAELVVERAKRLVEEGKDVVLLLDSLTRLARAYNLAAPSSGRILSGGVEAGALLAPKKFLGAARAMEEGGSLTIIATALVETGSLADTVIFEEFKGTGNMEVRLDRRLAERHLYPAIDLTASGTRRDELLLDPRELEAVTHLRRAVASMDALAARELLEERFKSTSSNAEIFLSILRSVS